jgi:hypothetical protein
MDLLHLAVIDQILRSRKLVVPDVHLNSLSQVLAFAVLLGLAACGATERSASEPSGRNQPGNDIALKAPALDMAPSDIPDSVEPGEMPLNHTAILSCAAEVGKPAAQRKAEVCSNVSAATHPPCNAANSCAMIEDEIARSCALLEGKGPAIAGCEPEPKSMAAAAAVVERYYLAINARDFGTAWRQWGEHGAPNQTLANFAAGFSRTQSSHVTIGTLEPGSAGAGSIYQTVPVTIDATLNDGTHQQFTGDYLLRRVNGVDGASPAQLRWHIDAAHLKAVAKRQD